MSLDRINLRERLSLFLQNAFNSCITFIAPSQHCLLLAIMMGGSSLFQWFFKHLRSFGYPSRAAESLSKLSSWNNWLLNQWLAHGQEINKQILRSLIRVSGIRMNARSSRMVREFQRAFLMLGIC